MNLLFRDCVYETIKNESKLTIYTVKIPLNGIIVIPERRVELLNPQYSHAHDSQTAPL